MKIAEIHLFVIQIPFKETFRHSLAARQHAENVVVKLKTTDGVEGFGECVPRDYVTGETIQTVLQTVSKAFAPLLWKEEWPHADSILPYLKEWGSQLRDEAKVPEESVLAARCAVELALLDAAGKTFGCSAVQLLGWKEKWQPVFYSGVISSESPAKAARKAFLMRLYQFKAVKLKVGGEADTEKIARVRKSLGNGVDLRLDANGAWTSRLAIKKINEWKPFGISAVEQPVPKEDWEGMQQVTAETDVDIVADESLCSIGDALRLSELKGCDIFNIRLSKCGGFYNAGEIDRIARERGLQSQLGCQVGETAILSSAGRLFAQTHPHLRYLEGSYEKFLLKQDLSKKRVRFYYKGKGNPITGPGLGVEILPEWLNQVTQTYKTIKRS